MEKLALILMTVGLVCIIIPVLYACLWVHTMFGIFVLGLLIIAVASFIHEYPEEGTSSNVDNYDE